MKKLFPFFVLFGLVLTSFTYYSFATTSAEPEKRIQLYFGMGAAFGEFKGILFHFGGMTRIYNNIFFDLSGELYKYVYTACANMVLKFPIKGSSFIFSRIGGGYFLAAINYKEKKYWNDELNPGINFGIGFEHNFTKSFGINIETMFKLMFANETESWFRVSGGVVFKMDRF